MMSLQRVSAQVTSRLWQCGWIDIFGSFTYRTVFDASIRVSYRVLLYFQNKGTNTLAGVYIGISHIQNFPEVRSKRTPYFTKNNIPHHDTVSTRDPDVANLA